MKRPLVKWIVGLIVIAAVGYYINSHLQGSQQGGRFVTAAVDHGDIQQFVSASGTLNPVKLVNVGTQVSGVVKALHADFNDKVTENQVLAELDPSLLNAQLEQSQAALDSANAALKLADANYKRELALFNQRYVARADLDQAVQAKEAAEAQVQTAKAQVERDKVNLGYAVIHSPVSGVIISRQVDVGQTVAASFQTPTLFTIAQDLTKMEIDTSMSEADIGSIREKMPVRFTVDAFPGRQFDGNVRQVRLNPTNVQNVVTYNVVIDVENDDLTLLPGMTAFVTLIEAEHKDVLRVPNAALNFKLSDKKIDRTAQMKTDAPKDDTHGIYVLQDGAPVRVKIKIGISDGKYTEVIGDELKEGDLVITEDTKAVKQASKSSNFGPPPPGGMGMR